MPASTMATPNGFVEGSEFMPRRLSVHRGLKVLCEGGVVEFMFRAGGVSVEMGGGNSLVVHEPGKSYPLTPSRATPTRTRSPISSIACGQAARRRSARPSRRALAVRVANAARQSFETGAVVLI